MPIAGVVLATLAAPAFATLTRVGPATLVGSGALGNETPGVAFDPAHNAYLVIRGDGGQSTSRPVFAQLVAPDGTLIGGSLKLTGCPAGVEVYGSKPKVTFTSTSDNAFVVTYREYCGGAVTQYVRLLRYSAGGVVSIGQAAFRVGGNPGAVVYNTLRHEAVTVWEQNGGTSGWDVWYRVLRFTRDANGAITGVAALPAAAPVSIAAKTQGLPSIALDPASQTYFIVFQGEDPNSTSLAMMAKTMDADTYALSPLLFVNVGGYPVEAAIVYLPPQGQFAVYWRQGTDIVGRRFTAAGSPATGIFPVLATPSTDGAASAAFDTSTSSGIVVGMNGDYYVWGSEVGSDGRPVDTFRASTAPPTIPSGGTLFPNVTATNTGRFGLVYGLNYTKVYMDRYTASGGSPLPPPCTIGTTPASASAAAAGGTGNISVTVSGTCTWSASSSATWLTVTPTSGTVSGTVKWTAAVNGTTSARSANVTISGHVTTISQAAGSGGTGGSGGPVTGSNLNLQFDGTSGGDFATYNKSTGAFAVRLYDGSPFTTSDARTLLSGWQMFPARFNSDGLTDLFFYNPASGEWRKAIDTGGGVLSIYFPPAKIGTGWLATVLDLNGDGLSDVFLYNPTTGAWKRCISTSPGGTDFTYTTGTWATGWAVYKAKFNTDTHDDLLLYKPGGATAGQWARALSQADGTFSLIAGTTNWGAGMQVYTGDYDGNGITDAFLYRPSDGHAALVTFTATTFTTVTSALLPGWTVHQGDITGDGKTDLFLYNPSSGRWLVRTSSAGWFAINDTGGTAGTGWDLRVCYLDGDAKADVLWYKPSTGATRVWITQGPTVYTLINGPTLGTGLTLVP